ncbi:ATP-binding protein [Desulfonema magnum]|uniref:STAS domain-containing protein n=1 Tax=Desulfonema magnum TaxID=45655 RepID=A0A975BN74_9BACT|nr:ATP-binding protein [Desulfonema magnum]QTA88642.1 STAS domain-containing protein [Desulfonema magnum]
MLHIFQNEEFIQFKLSSEIKIVNNVIQNVRGYLKQYSIEDNQAFILTLRELLNNAIEHGNSKIPELNVTASIERIGDMRFKIVVEDEGKGFDYEALDLNMPDDPSQIRNRGLSLVNTFSDQLEFSSKGNCVTSYITLTRETRFDVTDDTSWKVIRPTGDITAETAEAFRTLLLNLINEGHYKYRFDLSDVEDIDSIVLSIFVIFSNMVSDRFPEAELQIVHTSKDIINLFRMTRLDNNYTIS